MTDKTSEIVFTRSNSAESGTGFYYEADQRLVFMLDGIAVEPEHWLAVMRERGYVAPATSAPGAVETTSTELRAIGYEQRGGSLFYGCPGLHVEPGFRPICYLDEAQTALASVERAAPASQDVPLLQEQASAWFKVADALSEVYPEWHDIDGTGQDKAVAAIRKLAALAAACTRAPEAREPTISTEHGPWKPSTMHEGETYCARCLCRSVFSDKRKCDPHVATPTARSDAGQDGEA